jgi:hypothetical protein
LGQNVKRMRVLEINRFGPPAEARQAFLSLRNERTCAGHVPKSTGTFRRDQRLSQRMSTAMEHIHPISSVYRDGRDIAQCPPIRQFAPIVGDLIDEFAFPKPGRHRSSPGVLAPRSIGNASYQR